MKRTLGHNLWVTLVSLLKVTFSHPLLPPLPQLTESLYSLLVLRKMWCKQTQSSRATHRWTPSTHPIDGEQRKWVKGNVIFSHQRMVYNSTGKTRVPLMLILALGENFFTQLKAAQVPTPQLVSSKDQEAKEFWVWVVVAILALLRKTNVI